MAIVVVVAVKDSAIQQFSRPFFVPSVAAAIRSFTDEVNRPAEDNQMYRHPEDFEMYELAQFDEERGSFKVPEAGVRVLVRAKDVFQRKEG